MNKRVLIIVGVIVVVSLVFLFFKFSHKECVQVTIQINPEKPVQGQSITFKCNAEDGDNISWDFGDNSEKLKGIEATHKYKAAGTYIVKAIKSEDCITDKEIAVIPKRVRQWITAAINYPSEIHVNEPITITDATSGATTWNWSITEGGEVSNDKSLNATFKKAGQYTINLNSKGDNFIVDTSFAIFVIEGVASSSKTEVTKPSSIQKANVEPKAVVKETPKSTPALEPKAVTETKPNVEAKSTPIVEPKAKADPKPVSETKPKAEIKPKVEPAAVFLSDADFTSSFVSIANALANEDDNASNEWRDKIVLQSGPAGTMKVIVKNGAQQLEKSLESFKKIQLISSEPYKVLDVKEIKRATKNGPITQITVIVSKN